MRDSKTLDEWEGYLGRQVRAARVAARLDQAQVAGLANVSVRSVSNLERGKGSSLKTLLSVVRALGRTDWLEALAPPVAVSPMQVLLAKQKPPRPRVRVRSRRADAQGSS
jgi:transcriptional regulator with XRE-family HTH domain